MKMQNETFIVEYCSFCDTENEIRWDVETEGYEAFCPHCGKKMMICSECLRASDNELQMCDWFEGKCFRCTGLMNSECVQSADVEEVRHGQWLPQIVSGVKAWDCSECKTLGSPHWKRCPVCEAKMDGGKVE